MNELTTTAKRALEAYGGADRWRRARRITAEVSVEGWAFRMKRRPFFDRASVELEVDRPWSRLMPIGRKPGVAGILDGADVRLEDGNGKVLKQRTNARSYFPYGRRLLFWDDLDMAYFANYAFWNYFTLPALLLRNDIAWREESEGMLLAEFPEELPTHCRSQAFRFDRETGLLRQHDYTADVIAPLARAAHVIEAHGEKDGVLFASHRVVTPRRPDGKPLPRPELIRIEVHKFELLMD